MSGGHGRSARPGAGRVAPGALSLALAALLAPAGGSAQDVEAVAELRGLEVPAGYYERLARDPNAFTLPNGLFRATPAGLAAARVEGTVRLPVLLALFSDSPAPHVGRDDVQRALFDGPAERGTVTEAYLEMSRGALEVRGDVLPWVRTDRTLLATVGTSSGLGDDADVRTYLREALALADPYVDFGLYDSDGPDGLPNSGDDDGYVDATTFEFLEVSGSCGGPGIWPHRSGLSRGEGGAYLTDDLGPGGTPVAVDGYIVQSVVECDGVTVQSANVIAHEFGHVLGLPDYYHPTASGGALGRRWVLGCWSLMAAGSWGCGPVGEVRTPFGPTHLDAHSKSVLGWLELLELGEVWDHELVLAPSQTSGHGLRIALDDAGTEFLELEYRARYGFDRQLPAEGVLVYHYDLNGELRPDTAGSVPYRLALVEADGNDGLTRNTYEGGNRGEAGDAWSVGGVARRLHAASVPAIWLNEGPASTVTIHEVRVEDGLARLRISTGATPRISAPAEAFVVPQVTPFLLRVRVGGGRMPYQPEGSPPAGFRLYALHDELLVAGSVMGTDTITVAVSVRDAAGSSSPGATLRVVGGAPWTVTEERLLQPFLRSAAAPLATAEVDYLDALANGNGRYDVGDLRRWLLDAELSARVVR